jgi:hypothetical protein
MTTTPAQFPLLAKSRFLGTAMAGAYAVLNVLLAVLAPLTEGWPTYGTTALAVPPMVLAMVYVVIPLARKA